MKVVNATQARRNIGKLIDEALESKEPIQIIGKRGNVILISENDWHAIQETLYLLSIPGMREAIIEGRNEPINECKTLEDIGWDI